MQVSAIHTYPIKGCRRLDHDTAAVEPWGLAGDRRWLITDLSGVAITQRDVNSLALLRAEPGPGGLTLSHPGKSSFLVPPKAPDPKSVGDVWGHAIPATSIGAGADRWLSEALGLEARLVWMDDPTLREVGRDYGLPGDVVSFADAYPVLLANEASLDQVNKWISEGDTAQEGPVPMTRFRANIIITGAAPFAEDDWTRKVIHIGETAYRVGEPCGRCVVTTVDQDTAEKGREPLRTLGRHRNIDQGLRFGANLIPVAPGKVSIGDEVTVSPA